MAEVRLYVEGGGNRAEGKAALRRGFGAFLRELVSLARRNRVGWAVVPCGDRSATLKAFTHACQDHPDALKVLVVDAERPVTRSPAEHVADAANQPLPDGSDVSYHLMVQAMEAWLIADIEALARFYGQRFNASAIPARADVEQVTVRELLSALANATRNTQKGSYLKIRHGARLLEEVDPGIVRRAAPHCERLFDELRDELAAR